MGPASNLSRHWQPLRAGGRSRLAHRVTTLLCDRLLTMWGALPLSFDGCTGVEYDESAHFPGMIYGATAAAAKASHAAGLSKKGRSVPVLRLPRTEADPVGRALVDSADILEYLGTLRGGSWLFPQDTAAEVRELCAYFDAKLGPHTRRYGYHHMLPRMVLSTRLLRHKVAPLEAAVGTLAFPFLRGFVRKGLNISPAKAEESLQRVRAVFDEVGNVLARDSGPVAGGGSSRGFLVGDSFTAADLTFAALSAMLLLPPHYGVPLPEPEEVGQEAAAVIAEMRATPAGMHAMRMYGQCRTPATP